MSSFRNQQQTPANASNSKFVIKKDDMPKLKNLIQSIEDDPNADPFKEPVDWQGKIYLYSSSFKIYQWINV